MKPYISIDVETTGLNYKLCSILQLSMVLDHDSSIPVEDLPFVNFLVKSSSGRVSGEYFALQMNDMILRKLAGVLPLSIKNKERVVLDCDLFEQVYSTIDDFKELAGLKKIQLASKNPSALDIPIINEHFFKFRGDNSETILDLTHHRSIDVGTLYATHFGENPGLVEINKLIGKTKPSHDAYEDALDNIRAIREAAKKSDPF